MTAEQSAATTSNYVVSMRQLRAGVGLARRHGWDIEAIKHAAGISPMAETQGRCRITSDQAARLVRELWRITDDELMGLAMQQVPRGTLRLVALALVSAPDIRTALRRYGQASRALPGIPTMRVIVGPRETAVALGLATADEAADLLVDVLLAACHRLIGWSIGKKPPLRRVEVPYFQPHDVDEYHLAFGTPVVFSAPAAAVVFDNCVLDAPLVRTESELDEFLRNAPAGLLTRHYYGTSMSDRVREVLIEEGQTGKRPTMEDVARRLAVSPQTVRRLLHNEQTSMRQIHEMLMRNAAIASLVSGKESVAALSRRLGFSEVSAFSRAFRRWTGRTPTSYLPRGSAAQ